MTLYESLCGKPSGSDVPLALTQITKGSCALRFVPKKDNEKAVELIHRAINSRGKDDPPDVRAAIKRLHEVGNNVGAVRLKVLGKQAKKYPTLYVSTPVDEPSLAHSYTTTLHGRVGSIKRGRSGCLLGIDPLEGGGRIDMRVDEDIVSRAAGLFDREVVLNAVIDERGGVEHWTAVDIEPFQESNLLDALLAVRRELAERGVEADPLQLIEELDL